jgi:hypothetical protein
MLRKLFGLVRQGHVPRRRPSAAPARKPRRLPLRLEPLEERCTPTATGGPHVQVSLAGGVLRAVGDNSGNVITLDHSGSVTTLQGQSFQDSAISRIEINSGDGDDTINVVATARQVTVNGGGGQNFIHLGSPRGGLAGLLASTYVYASPSVAGILGWNTILADDCGCLHPHTYTISVSGTTGMLHKEDGSSIGLAPLTYDTTKTNEVDFISGSHGGDVVNVLSTAPNVLITLDACANDTVNVGNTTHGVQDIRGPVYLNNKVHFGLGPYKSVLNVNDCGDTTARTATLSASNVLGKIEGLAQATISYSPASLSALNVTTGGGDDTVNVLSTAPSFPVTLNSWAGHDTVNVGNSLDGVQDVRGPLTVLNGPAWSTLNVDDSSSGTSQSATLSLNTITGIGTIANLAPANISYQQNDLSDLNIFGGSGGNSFNVQNTGRGSYPMVTRLHAGSGSDLVTVQATTGALVVDGGAGNNWLIGASPNPQTWNLTSNNGGTLSGASFAGPVTFSSCQNLLGGASSDTFVFADGVGVDGLINGGGGANTLDYSAYSTTVIVDLQTGQATGVFGFGAGGVANIQNVFGGVGGPACGAGAPYNILVGNGGNLLVGGNGRRNLLIAGPTPSTLVGGDDDDILIGGTTAWDTNIPALNAIMLEWTQCVPDDYATRADHLMNGGGLNGPFVLNAATVSNNGGGNVLLGHNGGATELNLYYGSAGDLADNAASELFVLV